MPQCSEQIGAVAIGRNQREHLRLCLNALLRQTQRVVYVDSDSADGSQDMARSMGIEVVELDPSTPFTAARARNAGFHDLQERWPEVDFVQFVDGDMEVVDGWIATAAAALQAQPQAVAVSGQRRERHPERSLYNRICDVEWRIVASGPQASFGGDVMIRSSAFAAAGGYDPAVAAAEDDELAIRLRKMGGVLLRIDRESTLHDADMEHWHQWWVRAQRCGYAYAQVGSLHGSASERKFVREIRRAWILGAILPGLLVILLAPTRGLSALAMLFYPLNAARIALGTRRVGFSWRDSTAWGVSCALSSIPQAFGAARFNLDRLLGRRRS